MALLITLTLIIIIDFCKNKSTKLFTMPKTFLDQIEDRKLKNILVNVTYNWRCAIFLGMIVIP